MASMRRRCANTTAIVSALSILAISMTGCSAALDASGSARAADAPSEAVSSRIRLRVGERPKRSAAEDCAGTASSCVTLSGVEPVAAGRPTRALTDLERDLPRAPFPPDDAALRTYIELYRQPVDPSVAARAKAAGIIVIGYIDVNACSAGTFKDANGRPDGENPYATPDCGRLPPSAFYRAASSMHAGSEPAIFTTSDGPRGALQYLGNPGSAELRRAAIAAVEKNYVRDYTWVLVDDVTSLNEMGTLCAGLGAFLDEPGGRKYACPKERQTNDPGDVEGYSYERFKSDEEGLIDALPMPVIVNGVTASGTPPPSAGAAIVEGASNAIGGLCEACFENGNNIYALPSILANLASVIGSGKKVIVTSERRTESPEARIANLASLMQTYDYARTYESTALFCAGRSGLDVCPETALVFAPDGPYRTSDMVVYRTGSCTVGSIDYGPCVAEVNTDTVKAKKTIDVFPSGVRLIPLALDTTDDFITCSKRRTCLAPAAGERVPPMLTSGQGVIALPAEVATPGGAANMCTIARAGALQCPDMGVPPRREK